MNGREFSCDVPGLWSSWGLLSAGIPWPPGDGLDAAGFQPLLRGVLIRVEVEEAAKCLSRAIDQPFGKWFGAAIKAPFQCLYWSAEMLFHVEQMSRCSSMGKLVRPPPPPTQVRSRHVASTL